MGMKWSPVLHALTVLFVFLGLLALLGAWLAEVTGSVLGLSQDHLFSDATVLTLLGIAFGIGTVLHRDLERQKP